MKGRLEHEFRINNNIKWILKNLPLEVSQFYYVLRIGREPTTCLEYIRKINRFYEFVNKDLKEVTNLDIAYYFDSFLYIIEEKEAKKISSAYQQGVWSALNQFYSFLYSNHIISNNPMENIPRPKFTDKVERISLSMEDLNKILQVVDEQPYTDWVERDKTILYLFMNTGMRKTALSEINVEDISFEKNTLTIIDKRNKLQEYYLSDALKTNLLLWLYKRAKLLNGKKEDALFISSHLNRISEKAVYNIVKKYSQRALGYSISPHKLRASFVSLYYEASGHDIKATCQAVGHANIATTSLYVVKKNDAREDAINFMSKNLKI